MPVEPKSVWGLIKPGRIIIGDAPVTSDRWECVEDCPDCDYRWIASTLRLHEAPHCVDDVYIFECPRCGAMWAFYPTRVTTFERCKPGRKLSQRNRQ